MATKQIGWLIALLVATPSLYVACGGDESTSTTTGPATTTTGTAAGGAGGTAGSTGTGATAGTGGGAPDGSAGTGGKAGSDAGLVDGRLPCGMTSCNPNGQNPICDMTNNRCVGCLGDPDCASQPYAKTCDLRPSGQSMLPRGVCVACIDATQCPAGGTCNNGSCFVPCGTTMNGCTTNPTGSNICDTANNRCVDCMTDVDCAVEPTNKHCDTSVNTQGLPRYTCEECLDNSHCMANQVCVDNNCENKCATDTDCSADGGGRTPHCNPTTMICAECGTDAHCSGNQPFCAPDGNCVECTSDAQCATTQPTNPYCRMEDNNCVQCLTNDHCTPPATCSGQGRCGGGGPMDGGGMPPMPDSGGGGG